MTTCFLNINCAYEFWSDVRVPVLHCLDRRHPALYLPCLFVVAVTLNLAPFLLLACLTGSHFIVP